MNIGKIVISLAVFAPICCSSLSAQERALTPTKKSCLAFVEEFYNWYVPKARDTNVDSIDLALKDRRSAFSPRLLKGVEAVEANARRNKEAGLDFDWILNTQDPGDPGDPGYSVRNATLSGSMCRVEVYLQLPEGKFQKDVMPQLSFQNRRWLFANFLYPQSDNLLRQTRAYLDAATRPPKKPR
jgi:hypothetical protein